METEDDSKAHLIISTSKVLHQYNILVISSSYLVKDNRSSLQDFVRTQHYQDNAVTGEKLCIYVYYFFGLNIPPSPEEEHLQFLQMVLEQTVDYVLIANLSK